MTQRNLYLWPKGSELVFYTGRGICLKRSKDRKLDLSDTLMLYWNKASRTIYLGMTIKNDEWHWWDDNALITVEENIKYDLNFDDYMVSISRVTSVPDGEKFLCKNEFRWKLNIRTKTYLYSGTSSMKDSEEIKPVRGPKPIRFTQARSDASIINIQSTIERKLGLPSGSVKLVYPSGRKARNDSTVGALRLHWEMRG